MNNLRLNQISQTLAQMGIQPVVGAVKFKIVKIMKLVEDEMDTLRQAVDGLDVESQAYQDILYAENDITFKTKFTQADLEPFSLSAGQILILEPLIEEVEEC